MRRSILVLLAILCGSPGVVDAASPNNDVEWGGVSHVPWQDRRPLCPIGGETFQVRFRARANDLTSARVRMVTPAAAVHEAAIVETRGGYDVWAAQIPATASSTESYYVELTDGSDTDYWSLAGMSDGVPAPANAFALDFTTLDHAPVGATPVTGGGAVFKVWAPNATSCHVRGEWNSFGLTDPMTKVGEHWIRHVPGATDRRQYKYFFNNNESTGWKPDARGRALNPASFYNTYVENPFRYAWGDTDYVTPPLDQLVVYQLHVGTFAGGPGDPFGGAPFPSRYVDVANRVAHLKDLGVNAVMLNPVTEFPGNESAGYNPITQWAPEQIYGSPDQLKFLVDTFHRNGIAVLFDVVWNHFDNTDNFLWFYDGTQIYYDNPPVGTPWGNQGDFDKPAVRDYFVHSGLTVLEEWHADGFRFDATDYMNQGAHGASGWSLMQRINDEVDRRYADKHVVAEQLPNDNWVTRPTSLGGAGFDSQYHDAFTDRLREETYDAGVGDPEMWKIRDILGGSGEYLHNRYAFNYLELHDEAWPTSGGQRSVKTIDTTAPHDDEFAKGRSKLAHGLVLTAPGVPALLMGTEWLESRDFGTSSPNRIDWGKKTTYAPIYAYFKKLIGLRRAAPALWADAPHQVFLLDEGGNVIGFRRWAGDRELVVIANFSNTNYSGYAIGLPRPGAWTELVNSQDVTYDGNGVGNAGGITASGPPSHGFGQSAVINVPRMGLLVLAPAGGIPVAVEAPALEPGLALAPVRPNPLRDRATFVFALPSAGRVRLTIHDVAGREVARVLDEERAAGGHTIAWTAGEPALQAGVYFARLESRGATHVRRFAVTR